MFVKVLDQSELRDSITQQLKALDQMIDEGLKLSRLPDGSYLPTKNPVALFKTLSGRGLDQVVQEMVRETCYRSEQVGPGSSALLVEFVLSLLSQIRKRKISVRDVQKLHEISSDLIQALPQQAVYPSLESIESTMNGLVDDPFSVALALEAVKLAGVECKIFVEPTPALTSTVERTGGFTFMLHPDSTFYKNGIWSYDNVRCFVVDGIIDNMAEIDTLLQSCHETHEPLAILARGFRGEVLATMRVNWLRGTLKAIPIRVDFDLETVNVLNDLAVVTNGDVTSSLKGELISTVKREDLPTVDRLTCKGRAVSITNSASMVRVMNHVQMLQQKRDSAGFQDVKEIIDRRIRSMSAASVMLRISSRTGPEYVERNQNVDLAIRCAQGMLRFGTINGQAFHRIIAEKQDTVSAAIDPLDRDWTLPVMSVAACLKFGTSLAQSLASTGTALIET